MSGIVYMFEDAEEEKPYEKVAYHRCMHIEGFIKKLRETMKIVGITFEGNNMGFIVEDK